MENYSNIFDAHCHYDDDWFEPDRKELLASLPSKGVCGTITNATDLKNVKTVLQLCSEFPFVYGTAGVHPECLEEPLPNDYIEQIAELCKNEKIVAIGEIGLDYYWDIPKEKQLPVVKAQLELAKELDMPVVFHDRDAHGDTMELLRYYRPKGLLHCYSGSVEMLKEVLKLGLSISLGGVVTFKNARVPVEVAKAVPVERLLLETDAPYLAPVPFRGKRCDSSLIAYTAKKISELKNIPTQQLIDITTENTKDLFCL